MKYSVTIIRTSFSDKTIDIEADSPEQAESIAITNAGNHLYSEFSTPEYSVEYIEPSK